MKFSTSLELTLIRRSRPASLALPKKHLVEMVKAYVSNAQIVIFDEPSTTFTSNEKILYKTIHSLQEKDAAILYITHLLEEIELIADRYYVIHQGRVIGTQSVSNSTKDDIIRMLSVPAEKNRYPRLNIPLAWHV